MRSTAWVALVTACQLARRTWARAWLAIEPLPSDARKDEVPDHGHGALGCIDEHGVPTPRKALEPDQRRRQRRGDIRLALDRRHGVFLPAQYEGRTLNPREDREEVERVPLATGPREPTGDLGMPEGAPDHLRIA